MIFYIILWTLFVILITVVIITIWDYCKTDNYSNIKYIELEDKSYLNINNCNFIQFHINHEAKNTWNISIVIDNQKYYIKQYNNKKEAVKELKKILNQIENNTLKL